jgi:hypothetical protein
MVQPELQVLEEEVNPDDEKPFEDYYFQNIAELLNRNHNSEKDDVKDIF